MSLIAILLSLAIEYFLGSLEDLRRFDWFHDFTAGLRQRLGRFALADGPLGVLLVFVLAGAAVGLVYWFLAGLLWILGFLFAIAALLYALGPKDLDHGMSGYIEAAERGDHEAAAWYAAEVLGRPAVGGAPGAIAREIYEGVFLQANERLFGVLFWFVLLGPVGAVVFRLACEAKYRWREDITGFGKSVHDLHRILIWLPARFVVLGYALAGSFSGTVERWRSLADFWQRDTEELLVASGVGALDPLAPLEAADVAQSEPLRAALGLVKRTLVLGVVGLAMLTIAGWVA